jgi:calpain-15
VKNTKEINERWDLIRQSVKSNYPMTALSIDLSNGKGDSVDEKTGLVANHYYTIVGIQNLTIDGKVRHLVQLRNPWGWREWNGNFSDQDKIWSAEVQKVTGYNANMKDGIFFMEYCDFNRYFKVFQVNYFRDDYIDSSFKLELVSAKQYWFKFQIDTPGTYYFSLHQVNSKMYPPSAKYTYSDVCMTMIRIDALGFGHNVNYARKNDKQSFFSYDCPKGLYYFKIHPFWTSFANQLTFSAYGPQSIQITYINPLELQPLWFYGVFA